MDRNALIQRYFKDRRSRDTHFGGYPFIAISRQMGAGGHSLGEAVLKAAEEHSYADLYWGWKLFDTELCEEVANEGDLHVSVQALVSEEYHSEISDFVHQMVSKETPQVAVYRRLFEIQRILATVGKVVLVGRGASFVTRNMRSGIRVRLVAPQEMRIERQMKALQVDKDEATRMVLKHDRERNRFVRDLFNKDIDDPAQYDAVWDSSETAIDSLAVRLIELVREKAKQVLPT